MTSELNSLYVWIWLPDATEPVVAGRLDRRGARFVFSYGRSYLDRPGAEAIYLPELPLDRFEHEPLDGPIPLCLDDAAPDSWGRAVINAHLGQVGNELDILTYLPAQPNRIHSAGAFPRLAGATARRFGCRCGRGQVGP
jgi:serine/threonine-protein kinase HipA